MSYYAPDALVFWIAVGLVSLTAVVAGLAPALQATRDTLTSFSAERSRFDARRGALAHRAAGWPRSR